MSGASAIGRRDPDQLRRFLESAAQIPSSPLAMAIFCGRYGEARRLLAELPNVLQQSKNRELDEVRETYQGRTSDAAEYAEAMECLAIFKTYESYPERIRLLELDLPADDLPDAPARTDETQRILGSSLDDAFELAARLDRLTCGVDGDCDTSRRSGRIHRFCCLPPPIRSLQNELRAAKSAVVRARMKDRRGQPRPTAPEADEILWCLYHGLEPVRQALTPEQFIERADVDVGVYARKHGMTQAQLEARMKHMGLSDRSYVTAEDESLRRMSSGCSIAWISWFESGSKFEERMVVLNRAADGRYAIVDPKLTHETWCSASELEALDLCMPDLNHDALQEWLMTR